MEHARTAGRIYRKRQEGAVQVPKVIVFFMFFFIFFSELGLTLNPVRSRTTQEQGCVSSPTEVTNFISFVCFVVAVFFLFCCTWSQLISVSSICTPTSCLQKQTAQEQGCARPRPAPCFISFVRKAVVFFFLCMWTQLISASSTGILTSCNIQGREDYIGYDRRARFGIEGSQFSSFSSFFCTWSQLLSAFSTGIPTSCNTRGREDDQRALVCASEVCDRLEKSSPPPGYLSRYRRFWVRVTQLISASSTGIPTSCSQNNNTRTQLCE